MKHKKIEGFENYSVSDFGNVRNDKTGRILEGKINQGYLRVHLMKNKRRHKIYIHKLTVEAFLLNPDKKNLLITLIITN